MDDTELIAEFVAESSDHLADVERQLLEIEAAGVAADPDLVNTVFRAVHSTKGAAGFLGFAKINQLAHEAENVLNLVRNREFFLDGAAVDVLLRATDLLRTMVRNAAHSNDVNIDAPLADLEALLERARGKTGEFAPATKPSLVEVHTQTSPVVDVATPTPNQSSVSATTPNTNSVTFVAPESTPASKPEPAKADSSVRISVQILDKLMNLAGELVLSRNQLLQAIEADGRQDRTWHNIGARIDQVTTELQESIMDSRLQPVGNVFNKFPRVVRDLAAKLQKQCNLNVEGQEVELDKTIIEAIADPLTHLIRNSLDHGVELPAVRAQQGKPATGTITLRAQHQAGKVIVVVADDGGGIDPDKLRNKAIAKGIITAEQADALSDRDAVRLIFHPGFSTAEKVSDVSGRGVGMDVVKTNIERIGGTVEVQSTVGKGTTIEISLPLTLAIMPSLIVHCAGQRYAIPQSMIKELVAVRSSSRLARIEHIGGREVLRLRGQLIPLIRLANALGFVAQETDHPAADAGKAVQIVTVDAGQFRYAIAVDALEDPEEIVVKPLGKHARTSLCLAGATILGDGGIAFILDLAGLAAHLRLTPLSEQAGDQEVQVTRSRESHAVLLFLQGAHEQFGVPMASVTRIDRIDSEAIKSVGASEVITFAGRMIPVLRMDRHLQVSPLPEQKHYYVLVFQIGEHEFGLLASRLHEVRELSTALDLTSVVEPGILGSLVVDGLPTRMIDVFSLGRTAIQPRDTTRRTSRHSAQMPVRILLADDSDFFRRQILSFLELAGYEVTECVDGEEAWQRLRDGETFDLVVTDIEMPRLNGNDLCRRIKADPRWTAMPVIAITSLDGGKTRQEGLDAGFDEYESKIHRDQLTRAVERQLKRVTGHSMTKAPQARKESCC